MMVIVPVMVVVMLVVILVVVVVGATGRVMVVVAVTYHGCGKRLARDVPRGTTI
jgi:hypothetical protein